ncbi:MAG: HDIG domain-containing protein [Clostridiales bacterium]|nr:HDIG domain-containing protein [Clostridiales bacterium]
MEREKALNELNARLKTKNLVKHSLGVEAIMRSLARYFGENADDWGIAGLMHDIDYDKTAEEPLKHGLLGAEILEDLGIEEEIVYAVKAHNELLGFERNRKIDKALYCADPVSGLVTAGALILPSKKLDDVTVGFLIKRMGEKSFAKGASREQIKSCSELGISLEKFIEISLEAMKSISDEIGL